MKKFLLATLIISSFAFNGQSQNKQKIGHINSTKLMEVMPGKDTAQSKLEAYAKSLQEQAQIMSTEFQTKYQDYLANEATMLPPIKDAKQKELVDLQKRIEEFQSNSETIMAQKEQELLQPLIERAKTAINEVAKEKGYTYILDTGTGVVVFFDETDDITPFVKKKLGIL